MLQVRQSKNMLNFRVQAVLSWACNDLSCLSKQNRTCSTEEAHMTDRLTVISVALLFVTVILHNTFGTLSGSHLRRTGTQA